MLTPKQAEKSKTNLTERSENMFCVKCGTQLEDGYTFCPNCGTAQQHNEALIVDTASPKNESITINKSTFKKGILIAIIAVVLICIGFAVFSGSSDNKAVDVPKTSSKVTTEEKKVDVVGKWQEKNTPSVYMTLNKDNTGEMTSGGWAVKLNWTYSKSNHTVTLNVTGMNSMTAIYNPKDDTISQNGVIFVRVS